MRKFFEYLRHTLWRARLKTCFWLAPVHIGLICLAYLHALLAVVQIVCTACGVMLFRPLVAYVQASLLEDDPSAATCILPPTADLAFAAVLLAALHRRDVVLLRVYCWYVLGCIFIEFVVYGLLEALVLSVYLLLIILNGLYQIYILMLVRSLIIEIELNITDENKLIYHKDQGVVVIRDVESPTPIILGGYKVLPALPAPEMTTSITTLATLNEHQETPIDSKYNTLNKSNTLQTNTLKPYRIQDIDVSAQRSATLPHKDTVTVHRANNTQQIGAIHSLAGPSNFKPLGSNTDNLKKEFLSSSTTITGASDATSKNKAADSNKTEDKTKKDAETTDTESKEKKDDVPEKKKRGLFKRAPKEQIDTKKDVEIKPIQSEIEPDNVASTSKPMGSKSDIFKKEIVVSTTAPSVAITLKDVSIPKEVKTAKDANTHKGDITKVEEVTHDPEGKKEETSQKKKRGIFKKTPKESKKEKEKKKGDGDKSEES